MKQVENLEETDHKKQEEEEEDQGKADEQANEKFEDDYPVENTQNEPEQLVEGIENS